jgi:iron(III) transport system ATP-binding protein
MSVSVKLENVTKRFKTPGGGLVVAVDDLSLSIQKGSFVTLLGPSGCGKTTTLRIIAGFENPNTGRIFLDGAEITHIPPNRRGLAMVFQSYALFPHLSVFDNVAYSLKIKKASAEEIAEKVENALDLVNMLGMEDRYPNQLSGGQQQRVALARAIILRPKVLLFDEPLSNLDAKLREDMRERIRMLQRKLGTTSIYVTHDQIEAITMSDVIVVMNNGQIEQIGSPVDLYERPASKFVATFIGNVNLLEAKLLNRLPDGLLVDVFGKKATIKSFSASSPQMYITIRPEAVTLLPSEDFDGITFDGMIIKLVYVGQHVEYTIKLDAGPIITAIRLGNPGDLSGGEKVKVGFRFDSLHAVTT